MCIFLKNHTLLDILLMSQNRKYVYKKKLFLHIKYRFIFWKNSVYEITPYLKHVQKQIAPKSSPICQTFIRYVR